MRYVLSLCSYITTSSSEKPIYALIKNISHVGAAFESKANIELGDEVGLKIFLSKDKIITIIIKVLRKRPSQTNFMYDIQFINLTQHSNELFDELMSVLEKYDDDIFYNYIRSLNQ
jgi:phosphopantetheine adenylyltransferase